MAIFYTLEQVLSHIGEKKEFSDGDTFVFVFDGMVFRNKWDCWRNEFQNFTNWENSAYRLFRQKFFESESKVREFITPLLTRTYYSTNNLFDSYTTSDSTRIIVKMMELYESMRASKYSDSRWVKLSTKFYWENAYAKKSKVYEFWDGTVCLYEDIGRYIWSEENTPLFWIEYFYDWSGTRYYLMTRPKQIQYRDSRGNYGYIIRECITEASWLIEVKWQVYDKVEFFKNIGWLCEVTWQYYVWKRKLVSWGGLKSYHTDQQNIIVKATWGNMFFWVELERAEIVSIDYDQAAEDWWRCERDCSVAAEYISPVLSLDNVEESVEYIKNTSQGILDARISSSCWGHIHVSVKWVDSWLLWRKLAVFMPLMWAIYPERASNGFSKRPNKNYSAYGQDDRRDLVYKPHIWTVEFRIFPWCKGEKMLRFRLNLLNIIVKKALEYSDNVTFKEALDFILTSNDMFSMLSYVYNSADKMQGISQRISDCYRSVEKLSPDMDIQATLLMSVEEFVKSKSIPMDRSWVVADSI